MILSLEETKKIMKDCKKDTFDACRRCRFFNGNDYKCIDIVLENALRHLEKKEEFVWIDADNELPLKSGTYIVANETCGHAYTAHFYISTQEFSSRNKVKYWTFMPELPDNIARK